MGDAVADLPLKARTAKASALLSLKRTFDLFSGNYNFGQRTSADTDSQKLKLACKASFIRQHSCTHWLRMLTLLAAVKLGLRAQPSCLLLPASDLKLCMQIQSEYEGLKKFKLDPSKDKEEVAAKAEDGVASRSTTAKLLDEIAAKKSDKYACMFSPRLHGGGGGMAFFFSNLHLSLSETSFLWRSCGQ